MVFKVFRRLWAVMRTTAFLIALCVMLASATLSATIWAVQATASATVATAKLTRMAVAHQRELAALRTANRKNTARAVAKERVKGSMKRAVVAIPAVGTAAALAFAEWEYWDWKSDNPDGSRTDYACETGALAAEFADEILAVLPEAMRSDSFFGDLYGECDRQEGDVAETAPDPAPGETRQPWRRAKPELPPAAED